MNPSVPQSVLDEAYERDPASAAAEYGAEFRTDVEAFISREAVDAVVVPNLFELPPMFGVDYVAFVDPSGGSADSMTLAIAHREGGRAILDAIREAKPPFSPESIVNEFAVLLRSYSIKTCVGERYAGLWPRERFPQCVSFRSVLNSRTLSRCRALRTPTAPSWCHRHGCTAAGLRWRFAIPAGLTPSLARR
jgi:hypothetical protein